MPPMKLPLLRRSPDKRSTDAGIVPVTVCSPASVNGRDLIGDNDDDDDDLPRKDDRGLGTGSRPPVHLNSFTTVRVDTTRMPAVGMGSSVRAPFSPDNDPRGLVVAGEAAVSRW